LNLKHTPSVALSNRLMKRGNFLKSHKLLKYFYYVYLLRLKKKTIDMKNSFLYLHKTYLSFRDFDRVLFWKFNSLNCMFKNNIKYFRKKKKWLSSLKFVIKGKRILTAINFLKCLILLNCKRREKKLQYKLFNPLYEYLLEPRNNGPLKVKYRIYKLKLSQMRT